MKKIFTLLIIGLLGLSISRLHAATETFKIDPIHSSVAFKIKHLGLSWVNGSFKKFEGSIAFDTENPANSVIKVTVEADSVDTGNSGRDKDLVGSGYFDAAKYAKLSFESTKLVDKGNGVFEATGNFTLHGVTKPITITLNTAGPVTGMKGETRRGGDTAFTIKRSDYGMNRMIGPIGDEVQISLNFEAAK